MNVDFLFKIFFIFFALNIIFPSITAASEFKAGDNFVIAKGQVVNDDLYFAGNSITVDGIVNGDLVAAAGEIKVTGTINGGIIAAGGSIIISGNVTNDIRAAGGEVRISGNIGDNALIFAGNAVLEKAATVTRDITIGAGNAAIDGIVNGNINGGVSSLEMRGAAKGNVTLEIEDSIRVFPGATIGGDLEYSAPAPGDISGTVIGKTIFKETPAKKEGYMSRLSGEIIGFLMLLLIGMVSLFVAPELTQKIVDSVPDRPLRNLLFGLLFLIVTPILALILLITLIGIPLSLILLVIYIIILYISRIYVGFWIGKYVLKRLKKETKSRILTLVIGLIILLIGVNLPILGIFIHIIILLIGLGAVILTDYDVYKKLKGQKAI